MIIKKNDPLNVPPYLKTFITLLKKYTIIEFKSHADPLEQNSISKLLGYTGFYGDLKKFSLEDLLENTRCLLIVSKTPKWFSKNIISKFFFEFDINGVYSLKPFPNFIVTFIDQMDVNESNLIFLIFSPEQKLNKLFNKIIKKEINIGSFYTYIVKTFYENFSRLKDVKKIMESLEIDRMKNIAAAVNYIGIKKVIDAVGLEKVIDAVGLEKAIDAVELEKVIDAVGLEKIIDAVGLEKVIDAVGLEKVIDAVGLEKAIDAVGLEKIIDAVGLEKAIDAVGLEKIIDAVGLENVIKKVGIKEIEETLEKLRNKENL